MVSSSSIALTASALVAAITLSSFSATAAPALQKRASAKRGVAWPYDEEVNVSLFSPGSSWTYR